MERTMGSFIIMLSLALGSSIASSDELHSKLNATVRKDSKGHRHFTFALTPGAGLVKNLEGPWALDVSDAPELSFQKPKLGKADLNETDLSFSLETSTPPKTEKGKLNYKFVGFVCTADKSKCFRDVHKGSVMW